MLENTVQPSLGLKGHYVAKPVLTDYYQMTMAHAYWKSQKHNDHATFDLFFRKNPFDGEFTIFAGLEDCMLFLDNFRYTDQDIDYLKEVLPEAEPGFFQYLSKLTAKEVVIHAVLEGTVVFPKLPLLRVEGPLGLCQLLETTLLNLINFASLMATNAARYRMAAGKTELLEFGLRRAQGPNGGLTASKFAYVGGFDATSNLEAGKLYDIPVKGTHAHSFVMSFSSTDELPTKTLVQKGTDQEKNFVEICVNYREHLASHFGIILSQVNDGEFASFIGYAMASPNSFLALVDTYDVLREIRVSLPTTVLERLRSGALNFCAVALGLKDLGYKPVGVRIDSGDLSYLSRELQSMFESVANNFNYPSFRDLKIIASNDINEDTIIALNRQDHKINCFGIGTHLVTCQRQPALGCVYKLVEVKGRQTIKLSQEVSKVTIPGRKVVYRLYGKDGQALCDLMQKDDHGHPETIPEANVTVLCRHPFQESKRALVTPSQVELLLKEVWNKNGRIVPTPDPREHLRRTRDVVRGSLETIRSDITRSLNPTPYKVSVSEALYDRIHKMWQDNTPIGKLE